MSKVEELERAIEQLPPEDLEKLSHWMAQHRAAFTHEGTAVPLAFRDHSAFLSSYSPEDEGLYSDAHGR
jgi:hypothetical protein